MRCARSLLSPIRAVMLSAAVLAPPGGVAMAEELVSLTTRDAVTQSFLLAAPAAGKPAAVAVLFAGGEGNLNLPRLQGRTLLQRGNFLVRSRQLFLSRGIATALIDTPSDQPDGMDDLFRLGEAHSGDIAAVVAHLKAWHPGIPVYLVGTSRGTVSAAAGARLDVEVSGVVLTATLFNATRRGPGLSGFEFATIRSPVLFVHHVADACAATPYGRAKQLAASYPLVSVDGGKSARSGPCQALSPHGFFGREESTVDAIVTWMLKQRQQDRSLPDLWEVKK